MLLSFLTLRMIGAGYFIDILCRCEAAEWSINMDSEEQRLYLIKYLINENSQYSDIKIPKNDDEQKKLLRSLLNIRPPSPVAEEFIKVQDDYLKKEISSQKIVKCENLLPTDLNERIYLWQGDITTLVVDAIVNAANSALLGCFIPGHLCIDNIIHTLAGVQLRLACNEIMQKQGYPEKTGKAKITPAYNLPSKYVIHTVGPIISGELTEKDKSLLADCYSSCLEVAVKNDVKSIAFCCISTGVFSFPQEEAAKIAVSTVTKFLSVYDEIEKVIFNVFTDKDFAIYQNILNG